MPLYRILADIDGTKSFSLTHELLKQRNLYSVTGWNTSNNIALVQSGPLQNTFFIFG